MLTVLCFVLTATTATASSEWEMNGAPRFINDNIHNEKDVQVPKNVLRPPSIYIEPPYEIYYKAGETFELPCEADGEPKPTYDWNRNEIVFNPFGNDDRIVQLSDAGTLIINMPEDKDEGIFQCFAKNDFGRSASKKVILKQAKMASFAFARPTYHTPSLGRPYTLPCVPPESVPPASVFWIIKTAQGGFNVVKYHSRISMDREYSLRITNVVETDANQGLPYACMAMNNVVRSHVEGPLHFLAPTGDTEDTLPVAYLWSDSEDSVGFLGTSVSLKCMFSGNPTPDVHWERADNRTMSDRVLTTYTPLEILIMNLQFEDEGVYICWASNSLSDRPLNHQIQLTVHAKPYFVLEPKDINSGIGATIEIYCNASGVPEPTFEWLVDGVSLKDVKDSRLTRPRFTVMATNKLVLQNVTLADKMVFQCNASNQYGYVFGDFYLNVLAEAPVILTPAGTVTEISEGNDVMIVCEVTGLPAPHLAWYKTTMLLTATRYTTLSNGFLLIQNVVLDDAGSYVCLAENELNRTHVNLTLVVWRKPRMVKPPSDQVVIVGTYVTFTCSATLDADSNRSVKILWKKEHSYITEYDLGLVSYNDSLFIVHASGRDSGLYTCVAMNGLANITASASLLVRDRPQPPFDVSWTTCQNYATITWRPGRDNGEPVQNYVIQFSTSFYPKNWKFGLEVNASFSQVNMTLFPFVNYTFRVIAANKIGESDPSEPSRNVCSTKADRPNTHPQNVRTIGSSYGRLHIMWTPVSPDKQCGPGFFYLLQIQRVRGQLLLNKTIDNWETSSFEMVTALVYEPYEITIRSINSLGDASTDPATIIGYSYEQTPTVSPTNFSVEEEGDTYAIFRWEFETSEVGKYQSRIRGEFKGFAIIFWEENDKELTSREHDVSSDILKYASMNTFTARVDGMVPNRKMEAQIAVMNNYYLGIPTESISFNTTPGYLGSVEYLRVAEAGDTYITLKWAGPFESRGVVVGYDLLFCTVHGLSLGPLKAKEPQINDPDETEANITHLNSSSKYRFYIYPRSVLGRGEEYFIEVVTANPPARPDPPKNVKWTACDSNATIEWTPGNDNRSPLQFYILQFQTTFNKDVWEFGLKVNATYNEVNMTLSPNVKYRFRLIANNGVGASDPSFPTSRICTSWPEKPDIHPKNLRSLGDKYGKFYIEWTPVPISMQNGPNFHYYLEITRLSDNLERNETKITNWTVSYYELLVRFPYEPYLVTIKSVNSVGEASEEPPKIIAHSYEDVPIIGVTNVRVEAGNTSALVKWEFENREIDKYQSKIRGEFRGFKILYWEQNNNEFTVSMKVISPAIVANRSGTEFMSQVDSLLFSVTYEAQVAVINNYFTGIPNDPVTFRTGIGPPNILTALNLETEVTEGQHVTLACEVKSEPKAVITWFKDNSQIISSREGVQILTNGSLVIQVVMTTDAGQYTCRADNGYHVTNVTGRLVVKRKSHLNSGSNVMMTTLLISLLACIANTVGDNFNAV